MKKSLARQIEEISSNTQQDKYGQMKYQSSNFKCEFSPEYREELISRARRMERKKKPVFKTPISQQILAFLYRYKEIIPLYIEMVNKDKTYLYFQNRVRNRYPVSEAERILKDAVFGNKSDRIYAMCTMPKAWDRYKSPC